MSPSKSSKLTNLAELKAKLGQNDFCLNTHSVEQIRLWIQQSAAYFPNSLYLLFQQDQVVEHIGINSIQAQHIQKALQERLTPPLLKTATPNPKPANTLEYAGQHFVVLTSSLQIAQESWTLHALHPIVEQKSSTSPSLLSSANSRVIHILQSSLSNKMQHMLSVLQRVAITPFPVLVRGESGSGKELVAQAIHQLSLCADQAFVAINCAALNANILESELFGHVRGAFTGAIRDHKGVFERAAGGSLFLDEVAEIPLDLQAKLLRVLETGEFTPVGGEKAIRANVRIIAATHRALREEAKLGRFRQDLLYRLRVIPVFVPPLRERLEDIPQLTQHILQQFSDVPKLPNLTPQALEALLHYDWPGNVRELKNTLLYALTMAQSKSQIDVVDLPDEILYQEHDRFNPTATPNTNDNQNFAWQTDAIQSQRLQQALTTYPKQMHLAAQSLGISRSTLWRYRKKFGI